VTIFPKGEFWNSDLLGSTETGSVARFATTDSSCVLVNGISTDNGTEIPSKDSDIRVHGSEFDGEHRVNTSSFNPKLGIFVKREFDFTGSFVEIVSDLSIKRDIRARFLNISPVRLCGNWILKGMLVFNRNSNCPQWIENPSGYKSENPFLSAVFISPGGYSVEIGTGDDLWRWMLADSVEGAISSFNIEKRGDDWVLDRNLLLFEEESLIRRRDLRLSWYIQFGKETENSSRPLNPIKFSFLDMDFPCSTRITWKGQREEIPCMYSDCIRRKMKKFIRDVAEKGNFDAISFEGFKFLLCDSASHLGRDGTKILPHWNLLEINRFRKWANRILSRCGLNVPLTFSAASHLISMR